MIDALASAIAMVPLQAPSVQQDAEREALARYLRRIGSTPTEIEARLAAFDAARVETDSLPA